MIWQHWTGSKPGRSKMSWEKVTGGSTFCVFGCDEHLNFEQRQFMFTEHLKCANFVV
ncbi:unnamed protein product, partial [Nesidiocoris tenuis]